MVSRASSVVSCILRPEGWVDIFIQDHGLGSDGQTSMQFTIVNEHRIPQAPDDREYECVGSVLFEGQVWHVLQLLDEDNS
jgi:hypothetical protein